ncbi:50S ribosomal protein L25 [Treponema sp. OMZ 840]|uniref:50S ribosomal protein L25 n=1 Tax=Treponema sp. OMZ 840 TaxID=244313 RepID=UPI003D8CE2A2
MEELVLKAASRTATGKAAAKKLRAEGKLPAVMYNSKGEAFMLTVDESEFTKVWKTATATTLVSLVVDGKEGKPVLIKATEYDIITDKNLHVDFHAVDPEKPLTVRMNVLLRGNPVGVREGGALEKGIATVDIKCLPKDLPPRIVVDVTNLSLNAQLSVKDINAGSGVTVLTPADEIVAAVKPLR